jgi:hypothetical protein
MELGRVGYRAGQNLKCAIGILIPDELYKREMEGYMVGGLMDKFSEIRELFSDVNARLLEQLQETHDLSTPAMWPTKLQDTATVFGLTY